MELRPYQQQAIDELYQWLRDRKGEFDVDHNPLVVAPTGSGKSILIAKIIMDAMKSFSGSRVLMLTHQKELIEQNYEKLMQLYPECDAGIYSASVGFRHTSNKVIFAGIQSVCDKAELLGEFAVILIDEAHTCPTSGFGRYQRFISDMRRICTRLRVIGFTATPYRLDHGYLHEGTGRLFTDIATDIKIPPLIDEGYLSRVVSKATKFTVDMNGVKKSGGDYNQAESSKRMMQDNLTDKAIDDAIYRAAGRNHWIIFCITIKHAEAVMDALRDRFISAYLVTGLTAKKTREAMLTAFKAGDVQVLVNVGVLTTGFDAPLVDCVVMLRPTASTSLYIQMIGRGMRIAEGKTDCLVLDYAGNIQRHGCIDDPQIGINKKGEGTGEPPVKTCPECELIVPAAKKVCECGFVFPPPAAKIESKASAKALLSKDVEPEQHKVGSVSCRMHLKPGNNLPVLRVTYYSDHPVIPVTLATDWICINHPAGSWARDRADAWAEYWEYDNAKQKCSFMPEYITVLTQKKYPEIKKRMGKVPC